MPPLFRINSSNSTNNNNINNQFANSIDFADLDSSLSSLPTVEFSSSSSVDCPTSATFESMEDSFGVSSLSSMVLPLIDSDNESTSIEGGETFFVKGRAGRKISLQNIERQTVLSLLWRSNHDELFLEDRKGNLRGIMRLSPNKCISKCWDIYRSKPLYEGQRPAEVFGRHTKLYFVGTVKGKGHVFASDYGLKLHDPQDVEKRCMGKFLSKNFSTVLRSNSLYLGHKVFKDGVECAWFSSQADIVRLDVGPGIDVGILFCYLAAMEELDDNQL